MEPADSSDPPSVVLELSHSEALVLFELFARFEDTERLTIEHPGEEAALWLLQARLEKALVEPFHPRYTDFLNAAREELRRRKEGS